MTQEEKDKAREFFHQLWTDAASKKFQVRGRWYDREMKRKFSLIETLMWRGMQKD
jgi:hypothetical protein